MLPIGCATSHARNFKVKRAAFGLALTSTFAYEESVYVPKDVCVITHNALLDNYRIAKLFFWPIGLNTPGRVTLALVRGRVYVLVVGFPTLASSLGGRPEPPTK